MGAPEARYFESDNGWLTFAYCMAGQPDGRTWTEIGDKHGDTVMAFLRLGVLCGFFVYSFGGRLPHDTRTKTWVISNTASMVEEKGLFVETADVDRESLAEKGGGV